jgi:hypothetical protein
MTGEVGREGSAGADKATPRPWRVSEGDDWVAVSPLDGAEEIVADLIGPRHPRPEGIVRGEEEQFANAALIVRAVNLHERLVAVCRMLVEAQGHGDVGDVLKAMDAARQVLADVKEQP